ncbi:Protein of uncharacterised function (DUF2939) [Moraxella equi]|uniref:Protein of uncharacterized function (DUF2939) n=2 Tax=Moraxella equi TaxID=60442 RepID=A0A378QU56_9GAMM|nr:hypothetical protein B5J93_10075 [Moraxella equi]STZ03962.1 Protein of uncharacterised function (DUF2939) [Moraxella equi]
MPFIKRDWCDFLPIFKNLWQNTPHHPYYHHVFMKITKLLLALVIIALVIVAGSPYYKLYTLKNAYDNGDYAPIINSIDFEMLRPSLKHQLITKTDNWLGSNDVVRGLSLFGGLLGLDGAKLNTIAHSFINTAVDKGITPENLTRLAQGDVQPESEPMLVGIALFGGYVDTERLLTDYISTGDMNIAINNQKTAIATKASDNIGQPTQPKLSYCGLNCFEVATTIKDKPYTIVMHRHQVLDWQIVNVVLP